MTDSTHLLDTHARTVIHDVAQQISDIKPWQTVHRGALKRQALLSACRMYGYSSYADRVADATELLMPTPREDETRGEYALRLRHAAGKVAA